MLSRSKVAVRELVSLIFGIKLGCMGRGLYIPFIMYDDLNVCIYIMIIFISPGMSTALE